jgi:trk system potassium uptake protein
MSVRVPVSGLEISDLRRRSLIRITGALIGFLSFMMLPSLAVSLIYRDGNHLPFIESGALLALLGFALWWPVRDVRHELRIREGFLVVTVCWIVACFGGALPLVLSPQPGLSLTDAMFETMSGLTTTGATVIAGLDQLPQGVLFHRQVLCWFGGMGIVVLAIAVLPLLRIGGTQMIKAESSGPMKDAKMTPRVAETAKSLWLIYCGLTALCAAAYWLAGMTAFDAIGHAFSTLATAGFSTHDASFLYWNSPTIDLIAIVFMAAGAVNFGLHFLAWREASFKPYYADSEARSFVGIALGVSLLVGITLYVIDGYKDDYFTLLDCMRFALFQVVSLMTTTGFTTADISIWPPLAGALLMLVSVIGGCAGSTSGGIKVIRVVALWQMLVREFQRLVHPKGQFGVAIDGQPVENRVLESIAVFFFVYCLSLLLITILLAAGGVDVLTAGSAAIVMLGNVGPGLGTISATIAHFNDFSTWVCTFAMLLGRLELFTLLILLTPAFWRE